MNPSFPLSPRSYLLLPALFCDRRQSEWSLTKRDSALTLRPYTVRAGGREGGGGGRGGSPVNELSIISSFFLLLFVSPPVPLLFLVNCIMGDKDVGLQTIHDLQSSLVCSSDHVTKP